MTKKDSAGRQSLFYYFRKEISKEKLMHLSGEGALKHFPVKTDRQIINPACKTLDTVTCHAFPIDL